MLERYDNNLFQNFCKSTNFIEINARNEVKKNNKLNVFGGIFYNKNKICEIEMTELCTVIENDIDEIDEIDEFDEYDDICNDNNNENENENNNDNNNNENNNENENNDENENENENNNENDVIIYNEQYMVHYTIINEIENDKRIAANKNNKKFIMEIKGITNAYKKRLIINNIAKKFQNDNIKYTGNKMLILNILNILISTWWNNKGSNKSDHYYDKKYSNQIMGYYKKGTNKSNHYCGKKWGSRTIGYYKKNANKLDHYYVKK